MPFAQSAKQCVINLVETHENEMNYCKTMCFSSTIRRILMSA
jgi:hypothetical protein